MRVRLLCVVIDVLSGKFDSLLSLAQVFDTAGLQDGFRCHWNAKPISDLEVFLLIHRQTIDVNTFHVDDTHRVLIDVFLGKWGWRHGEIGRTLERNLDWRRDTCQRIPVETR